MRKTAETPRPTTGQPCISCKEREQWRRGLCQTCHKRYTRARLSIPEAFRDEWEAEQIAAGRVLPSEQGKKLKAGENAFSESAKDFIERLKERVKKGGDGE